MSLPTRRRRCLVRDAQQVVAGKTQLLGAHAARVGDQAHQRHHGHALARPGLADDAQHLAFVQRQAHALYRMHHAALGGELHVQVFDFEKRLAMVKLPTSRLRRSGHVGGMTSRVIIFQLGIERVTQTVAHQVEGQHGHQDRQAREGHDPPGAQHEFAGIGQHRSPLGRRRLRAQAEKAQGGGVENGGGNAQRGLHDQRRRAVGQHLAEHQPQGAGAADAGRRHIVLGHFGDHRGARDANVVRQDHDRHREHRVHQAGAQDGDDHDRQQQAGQREDDVHQPHDRDLDDAARESGDQPQRDAGRHRDQHHGHADRQRQARAVDQARKDVAADRVRSQQERGRAARLPRRGLEEGRAVGLVGHVRSEPGREQRHQQQRDHHQQPHHRAVVGGKRNPELAQRPGR